LENFDFFIQLIYSIGIMRIEIKIDENRNHDGKDDDTHLSWSKNLIKINNPFLSIYININTNLKKQKRHFYLFCLFDILTTNTHTIINGNL